MEKLTKAQRKEIFRIAVLAGLGYRRSTKLLHGIEGELYWITLNYPDIIQFPHMVVNMQVSGDRAKDAADKMREAFINLGKQLDNAKKATNKFMDEFVKRKPSEPWFAKFYQKNKQGYKK